MRVPDPSFDACQRDAPNVPVLAHIVMNLSSDLPGMIDQTSDA